MTHVTVTIPKHALLWQQYFFLHRIKLRDLLLSAVIVSLHYLLQMFAFNSHMRQNTQTLLFIGNTFKTLKLSFKIQYIHILYIERIKLTPLTNFSKLLVLLNSNLKLQT